MSKPKLGDIARCQRGCLGLITKIVTHSCGCPRCGPQITYKGVRLGLGTQEDRLPNWESTNPVVVGNLIHDQPFYSLIEYIETQDA